MKRRRVTAALRFTIASAVASAIATHARNPALKHI